MKYLISFLLSFFLIGGVTADAYVVPDNYYFFTGVMSGSGTITVYLPSNAEGCLALQGSTPINTCSSTVYGYINYNGTDYRITFSPFEYGTFGGSYNQTSYTLIMTSITDTNFHFNDEKSYVYFPDLEVICMSGIVILGGLLWLSYMMKSRH